jgi:hypothetical protein
MFSPAYNFFKWLLNDVQSDLNALYNIKIAVKIAFGK